MPELQHSATFSAHSAKALLTQGQAHLRHHSFGNMGLMKTPTTASLQRFVTYSIRSPLSRRDITQRTHSVIVGAFPNPSLPTFITVARNLHRPTGASHQSVPLDDVGPPH